jgi:hypothetical protein
MKLYPTITEVFDAPEAMFKAIFFPLLTIDLKKLNKGEGKVYFVTVWGNGDPDLNFKDDLFGFNFIKFDWTGEKYKFNGNLSSILPHLCQYYKAQRYSEGHSK